MGLNDIKIYRREKNIIFWAFIAPLIFIVFSGILFKEPIRSNPEVIIKNDDKNDLIAHSLSIILPQLGVNIFKEANDSSLPVILIPKGTIFKLHSDKKATIELHIKDEGSIKDRLALLRLKNALIEIILSIRSEQYKEEFKDGELKQLLTSNAIIILEEKMLSLHIKKIPYGFQRSVPAVMVMLLFINLFTYSVAQLVVEREQGHMRRLLISPVARWQIVIGKNASRLIWSIIQILVIVIVGIIAFNIKWGNDLKAFIILLILFAILSTSIGVYYSTFFKNQGKCAGIGSLIIMVMLALGGCWCPLEIVPQYLRYVAYIFPTGWAMDAFTKLMSFGYSFSEISLNLIAFLLSSIIFIILSSGRLI